MHRVPGSVQQFIYDHVDSVAFLEALLLFHSYPERPWTMNSAAVELRSNTNSTSACLEQLKALKLVREDAPGSFLYAPNTPELKKTIDELAESYRVHRHKIFELIFSPLKRARDFADAFKKKENKDG